MVFFFDSQSHDFRQGQHSNDRGRKVRKKGAQVAQSVRDAWFVHSFGHPSSMAFLFQRSGGTIFLPFSGSSAHRLIYCTRRYVSTKKDGKEIKIGRQTDNAAESETCHGYVEPVRLERDMLARAPTSPTQLTDAHRRTADRGQRGGGRASHMLRDIDTHS